MLKFLVFISVLFSFKIFACKCDPPTIESSFNDADYVFIADVYEVDKSYCTAFLNVENALAKIKIEKIYKSQGDNFRSKEATMFGQQFNSCDFIFSEKGKYLIFAYIDPDTSFFYSEHCLYTKPISEVTENELQLLDKMSIKFQKKMSIDENKSPEFSLTLRTPDKIINDQKLEIKQLSGHNQKLKKILIALSIFASVLLILVIILVRKKNQNPNL